MKIQPASHAAYLEDAPSVASGAAAGVGDADVGKHGRIHRAETVPPSVPLRNATYA